MPRTRPRIPNPLSLTVVITVVVALCFQAWMLREGYYRSLRIMSTRSANRAQATAHQVQSIFKQVDMLLMGVRDHVDAEEIVRGPGSESAKKVDHMRQFLSREAAKVPQVLLLHVVSPDGHYVYSSNATLPTISIADRSYFQKQRDATTDQLWVSEPLFGRVSQRWGVFPSRRLSTRDGRFAGIVFAIVDAQTLGSVMMAVDQNQWILSLYDDDQRLVARSPIGTSQIGTPAQDPRLTIAPGVPTSFIGSGLGEAAPHIWATQPVQGLPFQTCTGFSKERALAQWKKDLQINLAVAFLLVAGCAGVLVLQHRNQLSANAIKSLNDRMKMAATSVRMGIWEWEPSTDRLSWDIGMLELYGIEASMFAGNEASWLSLVLPEDRDQILKAQQDAIQGGPAFDVRFRVMVSGDRVRHLHATAVVREGEPTGLVGITWDITAAERAQHELRSSEAYFRTLFDTVPDAVAVIDEGEVIDANQRYLDLFQITKETKTPPWELAPTRQPNGYHSTEHGQRLSTLALAGALQRVSWQCLRSNGTTFDGELAITLFRHDERNLLIVIVRDLTEMRAMEEKLHQAQKLDALGQLAGGVAHDFNNMLTAILGAADLLSENLKDEREYLLARTIVSAAERAGQLTRKLLAFARKGKILSTPTDVHQILEEAVALLERTIDRKITISTQLQAENATVVGDPSQIQNALLNLGVNARDAMPSGGQITFTTELVGLSGNQCHLGNFQVDPGDYLHISVGDKGCGIPEAHLQKIFDPFFTTKDVDKGTGLGLAAVFGTMVSHRGAVTVDSHPNEGSTFHLYLPLISGLTATRPQQAGLIHQGNGRVLMIDDEDIVRTATSMLLEALGYQVLTESDGEQAIAYFQDHHHEIHAVLLDMVMPRISGAEVAGYLRKIDPKVPIILASGFPRNAEVNQLLDSGIAGFLQKPFSRRELGEMLARVIERE